MLRSLVFALAITVVGSADADAVQECESAVNARAQQDVQTLVSAVYGGDAQTVLKYTHPKVVQLQGGSTAARQAIRKVMEGMKTANMKMESLSFPAPATCVTVENRSFIVVPTLSIISAGGERFESLNYQLGVVEPGESSWTYVEGSRVNAQTIQLLFPGFPKDFKFPATYRKRI